MMKLYAILALLLAVSCSFAADNWTNDGQGGVYWTNNGYKISAYPATSHELINHYQYVNFSSTNPANIKVNLSFVFDQQPLSGDVVLWQNISYVERITDTTRAYGQYKVVGVINFTATNASCSIGDNQNTFKYDVTYNPQGNGTIHGIACFNNYTQAGSNYTIFYGYNVISYHNETKYKMGWGSILNLFTYTNTSNHAVYTINDVAFNGSTNYQTKFMYSFPMGTRGKFDIFAHAGSPASVVAGTAPIYVELDPWWNASFANEIDFNVTGVNTDTDVNANVFLNMSTTSSNGSDLRIVCNYSTDATPNWVEQSFWRRSRVYDNWNATYQSGWITIRLNTTAGAMRWCKAAFGATSTVIDKSNVYSTFIYGDDFLLNSSANYSTTAGCGTVSYNTTAQAYRSRGATSCKITPNPASTLSYNYVVETDYRMVTDTGGFGFIAPIGFSGATDLTSGYGAALRYNTQQITLLKVGDNYYDPQAFTFTKNVDYTSTVNLTASGTQKATARFIHNGTTSAAASLADGTYTAGYFGIRTEDSADSYITGFRVFKLPMLFSIGGAISTGGGSSPTFNTTVNYTSPTFADGGFVNGTAFLVNVTLNTSVLNTAVLYVNGTGSAMTCGSNYCQLNKTVASNGTWSYFVYGYNSTNISVSGNSSNRSVYMVFSMGGAPNVTVNYTTPTFADGAVVNDTAFDVKVTLNTSVLNVGMLYVNGTGYAMTCGANVCELNYTPASNGTWVYFVYAYNSTNASINGSTANRTVYLNYSAPNTAFISSAYILPTPLKSSQNATCYGVFGNITSSNSVYVEWYKNAGNISGVGVFATINANGTYNISTLSNASYTVGDLIQCKAYVNGGSAISPAITIVSTSYTITLYTPQQLLSTFWAAWGAYVLGLMSIGISYLVNRTVSSTCFSSSILLMASFFVYGSTAVALMWLAILLLALGFVFRGAGQ